MAGGIDWFRWHHGSVTDPKFQLVAKKAETSLGNVIAVWAFILEAASSDADRGSIGPLDFETLDFLLGAGDGTAARILDAMAARGLVTDSRIANWEKRQPKREDDGAAERKRRQRERDAANVPQQSDESRTVTQSHDREEKSREEEKKDTSPAKLPTCPHSDLVSLYHEVLPELPTVRLMDDKRKRAIGKVWTWVLTSSTPEGKKRASDAAEAVAWFRRYFERARDNDFLMGRTPRSGEHSGWRCDLDFLLTDKGMKQVIEKTLEAA